MKKESCVNHFDTITVEYPNGKHKTFRVNTKRNPGNRIYINKKVGDWVDDIYGRTCQIVSIQPNDPYVGLQDLLPVRSVDRYPYGITGKGRKWKAQNVYSYYPAVNTSDWIISLLEQIR